MELEDEERVTINDLKDYFKILIPAVIAEIKDLLTDIRKRIRS